MERLKPVSSVQPTSGTTSSVLPSIIVSATLAATTVSPYGDPSQYQSIGIDAKVSNRVSYAMDETGLRPSKEDVAMKSDTLEVRVSGMSREELDAKLSQNKSEVESIAAEMRRESAEFKTYYTQQFSSIERGIAEIKGEIGGLKTGLSTTQWAMAVGLTLVTVILSGVMLASSWIISGNDKSPSVTAPAPIIIQVPTQQPLMSAPTNQSSSQQAPKQ
ncbi:hypothetical protein RZZ46_15605 [Citrobacter amalonaticus]|uniref:hypothetical protein n=1 Tax=Citrobacter amalonaticus TaxID=35703 RepID=UPI0029340674|nr:hypothetical protein [Citrobacter amalonaticus]MEB0586145.1 hypothetical protein [Citrobacter amalonaticus]